MVSAERWFCVCRDGTEHLPLHDCSAAAKHAHTHVQPLPAQVTDPTIYLFTQNSFKGFLTAFCRKAQAHGYAAATYTGIFPPDSALARPGWRTDVISLIGVCSPEVVPF